MFKITAFFDFFYNNLFPGEHLLEQLCRLSFFSNKNTHYHNNIPKIKGINWYRFFHLVRHNKLQVVVAKTFSLDQVKSLIPDFIYKKIVLDRLLIQFYEEKQQKEFYQLLKKIGNSNLNIVVMKTFVYLPEILTDTLKVHCDLDLLVPTNSFKGVVSLLSQLGYKYVFDSSRADKKFSSSHSVDFYLPKSQEVFKKNGYTVELHATVVDSFPFLLNSLDLEKNQRMTQELYNNSVKTSYKDLIVKAFSPSAVILNFFLHSFFQHNLQSALTFYEFAHLIKTFGKKIDWNFVMLFTKKYDLQPYFLWFLCLFNELYPHTLPFRIQKKVNKYKNSLQILQLFLFYYMKYKIFNHTNFFGNYEKERQKEWAWTIINKNLLKFIYLKIKNKW